ncbi:putative permease of the major facilitator superfamily protein [Bartonella henselae]|uniref:Putative permease of the major facilitator superfamily protein n=1 Tax=Bartonella henselae TaxID=38323 RepID=X5MID4_BARHN|nr:putative permease of the major facilitator superfamily protein [Bartonella henselae]
MNFVLLLFLSASMILTVAFFQPRKEIAVILVCMIFYLIKYTYLCVEVVLHECISDNSRETYESFLSTVGRLSLLVFFYMSAYIGQYVWLFVISLYFRYIFIDLFIFSVFLEGTLKKAG